MEYIRDISINEATINVLDICADEPVLNDMRITLNETAYSYIYKLLCKVAKDEKLKYAKFNEGAEIKELANEYFKFGKSIVEISKEFSTKMFQIIKNNGIGSSDLLTVSVNTEYGPIIAILKMGYLEQFNHRIDIVDDKVGIGITPKEYLPKSIKQAAFIKAMKINGGYDLMVLNKERAVDEYGGNWFEEKFLQCAEIANERDITRQFINIAERFVRVNLKDDALKAEKARKTIKNKLKDNTSIDLNELSEELFTGDEENKENFIEALKNSDISDKVDIDKQYVERKLSTRKLKLAPDIELNISEEAYNDLSRFGVQDNLDGSINLVIKNIKNYSEK